MRGAELLAGVDAAVLAAQPLAVDQQRAAVRDADAGAGEALDRLAVEPLGRLALAQQRARAERGSRAPSRCRWPRRSPPAARAGRPRAPACRPAPPPRRGRPAATSGCRARAGPRRSARPRPAPRRSGRGRCSGPRCPSRWRRARAPRRAAPPPAGGPRPAPAPRSPARASWPARWRRAGRRGCRSPPPRRPPPRPARSPRRAGRRRAPRGSGRPGRSAARTARRSGGRARPGGRSSSSQATSSPSARATWHASHSQRSSSSSEIGLLAERAQRGLQRRRSGGVALGGEEREPVEQQVARARGGLPLRGEDGGGDLARVAAVHQPVGRQGRRERVEVGLARERRVERLEPPRRLEQQRRRVAAARRGEDDLRPQQLRPRAVELLERPGLRDREQAQRRLRRARLVLALRGHQRAPRPARRIGGQLGGALMEGRGRRHAATRPGAARPSARARRRRPRRARPSPARGARRGGRAPVGGVGRAPGGRAGGPPARPPPYTADRTSGWWKRTCAPSSIRPASAAGAPAPASIPSAAAAAPEQERVADRLGRRDEQQQAGRLRQRLEPLLVARLDAAGQRGLAVEPEAARQLGGRAAARQLEQGERVAARLGHDAIAHALVERAGHDGLEQRPRIAGFQPADDELVQLAEAPLAGGLAHGEDQPGRLRLQAARHERERLRPTPRSSHCASSTTQTSGRSSAASDSRPRTASPTRKRSGASPSLEPERRGERLALRAGEALEAIPERRAQQLQARRTRAPSRTRRPPRGRRGTRTRAPPGTPAARSCPRRPPRGARAPGSGPRARSPAADPAPRTRCAGRADRAWSWPRAEATWIAALAPGLPRVLSRPAGHTCRRCRTSRPAGCAPARRSAQDPSCRGCRGSAGGARALPSTRLGDERDLVDVAPAPRLARLGRARDRVPRGARVT